MKDYADSSFETLREWSHVSITPAYSFQSTFLFQGCKSLARKVFPLLRVSKSEHRIAPLPIILSSRLNENYKEFIMGKTQRPNKRKRSR